MAEQRILDLARKAGLVVFPPNGFDRFAMSPSEKEFARLIVQECIDVLNNNREDAAVKACVKTIKDRFGI